MAFTGITGTLTLSFVGKDPLLVGQQTLIANPTLGDVQAFVNGLVAVADAIDGSWVHKFGIKQPAGGQIGAFWSKGR